MSFFFLRAKRKKAYGTHEPFVNKTVGIFKSQSFGLVNISAPKVNFLGCYG